MTDLFFIRTPSGIAPADSETEEWLRKIKLGAGFRAECKRQRNIKFHRKAFSLFQLAFQHWEVSEQEYKGVKVERDFDRFRADITILAGHYTPQFNVRGEVQLKAKSLSFANMGEEEFERVYSGIKAVLWKKILQQVGYKSEAEVDSVLEKMLRYD